MVYVATYSYYSVLMVKFFLTISACINNTQLLLCCIAEFSKAF